MSEPKKPPQLFRRDFLVGVVGGLTAGGAASLAAPDGWHEGRLSPGTHLSYAQNGEDLVVESLFRAIGIDRPTYVDVGAYDPLICNNTYYFYRKGGHGVLVEPNPDLSSRLRSERPRDVVLTAGVGVDDTAELDYFIYSAPQLNSFDRSRAEKIEADTGGKVRHLRTVKMPLLNINRVIAEHLGAAPDYLSVDVEGLDLAILKTLDFDRFRPMIVCAEHSPDPAERAELIALLDRHGFAVRGQTYPNTIFVDRKRMS